MEMVIQMALSKKTKHHNKLVSVKETDNETNDWFLDLRNKEFFGANGTGKDASVNSAFKTLHEKAESDRGQDDTVKKKCEAAYSQNTTGIFPQYSEDDIKNSVI